MCLGVAARTAGIVERRRTRQSVSALRQAKLQKQIPDTDDLHPRVTAPFFLTAGTADNENRVAQFAQLPIQEFPRLLLQFRSPGPVDDRTAAAEDQRHTALEPLTQVQICRLYRLRGDRDSLAAGEKSIAAALESRLWTGQEGLVVGKQHVHQGKLVGSQRHLIGGHHILPGQMADMGHIKAIGTDHRALPAEGAAVHGFIELVVPHDDLGIVIDLLSQQPGMLFIMLQEGAAFQALLAATLEAARRLRHRQFFAVAFRRYRLPLQRCRGCEIRIQARLHRAFLAAGIAGIQILGQAIHGQCGFFCPEGRSHHALAAAADKLFCLAVHEIRQAFRRRKEFFCYRFRGAEHVKGRSLFFQKILCYCAIEDKIDVLCLQAFEFQLKGLFIQKFRPAAQERVQIRLLTEHGQRIGLFLQFPGKEKGEEAGTQDSDGFFLFRSKDAAAPRRLPEAGYRSFHSPDGNRIANLAQAAFPFARGFTAVGQDQREDRDLFIQLQGLFEIARGRRRQHGPGVQLQRAGGVAERRLLIDAERDHALDLFAGDLVHLIHMSGAALLNLSHNLHLPRVKTGGAVITAPPLYHG